MSEIEPQAEPIQASEDQQAQTRDPTATAAPRRLLKMKGRYPRGGPKIVRQEFERLGFTWVPPTTPNENCDSIWTMRMERDEMKALKPHQKVNFFPMMPELCWKHTLHHNIVRAKQQYGPEHFGFWPEGYVLPEDIEAIEKLYLQATGPIPLIIKPSLSAMGDGIRCATKFSDIRVDDPRIQKEKALVQHYIQNPLLLDGFKISFRIYVLVTSFNPMRVFVYPRGLCRISSQRFMTSEESFDNLYIHITNVDVNKANMDHFLSQKTAGVFTDGLRSDTDAIFGMLREQGKDVDRLWARMHDAIVKTFCCVEQKVGSVVSSYVPFRYNSYELLGYDFLIDEALNPWILEINHAPNLEPHTDLETKIKSDVIGEMLGLVDVLLKDGSALKRRMDEMLSLIQEMNNGTKSPLVLGDVDFSKLTKGEVYVICDTELEYQRRGQWMRLFPQEDSEKYFQFLPETSKSKKIVAILKLGLSVDEILQKMREC